MIKIAIDGLSGSGKGTIAQGLAKRFNLKHLDTGAIFRTMGVALWKSNILEPNEKDIEQILSSADIKISFNENIQQMFLNGEDVTNLLRTEVINNLVSKVSAFAFAREKYLKIVKDFANNNNCVIDGRDITSVVLPDADVKFYVTADDETRAKRRFLENQEKGVNTPLDKVLSNLLDRDFRDKNRAVAPLVLVEDAIVIDTTNLSIEETINYCSALVSEKIKT